MNAPRAVVEVENYLYATSPLAQTTLRSVLGQVDLDDLLSRRETLNVKLQAILDQHTDAWGIEVSLAEVKQVDLPLAFPIGLSAGQHHAVSGVIWCEVV